eukprot:1596155-Rhodomonas_salina.1
MPGGTFTVVSVGNRCLRGRSSERARTQREEGGSRTSASRPEAEGQEQAQRTCDKRREEEREE